MSRLPVQSGAEVAAALQRAGFEVRRQTGSHLMLRSAETGVVVPGPLPLHGGRDLPAGTLRSIMRDAWMTVDEFVVLLR